MRRLRKNLALFASSAFITLGLSVAIPTAFADQQPDPDLQGLRAVSDVSEAESLTGYSAAGIENIEEVLGAVQHQVSVNLSPRLVDADHPGRIQQTWISESNPQAYIVLIQDPALDGLANSDGPAVRLGPDAQRRSASASSGRPYGLEILFWRDGDMGYVVIASKVDGMGTDKAENLALSVETGQSAR